MNAPALCLGFTLSLCLLPAVASAQTGFPGRWDLEGKYSTRRATAAELLVSYTSGSIQVTRTGRFTSELHSGKPAFTWSSDLVRVEGRVMRVTFTVNASGSQGADGLAGNLTPDSSRESVVSALTKTNTFVAVYFLSVDKRSISEVAVNQTRFGDHRWWRWASTKGNRQTPPATAVLTRPEYERVRDETIRQAYLEGVRQYYAEELSFASDDDERRMLNEDRETDLNVNFETETDVSLGDFWFDQDIYERYTFLHEPYLDANGHEIPEAALEAVTHNYSPEHAGIGLSTPYLFDTRTGELIATGETTD
jgi:hypothetical protein